ncbi:tetratricopeptide repeat protein [Asticcacaulis sp. BYS171W]|uniref:Tetratricopeptide repeat protein n=1 Tax=Asticcacaulis aquaticus TaxID=2984212 RepID=A0ABT5HXT4_9CAUL|nr:tetratricopeptide repeat protein [Asticcacaulis aquaticus]MDC7684886.1 tetratricopeptide repeat protein [Asticcacaulis aquaticus]
MNFTVDDLLERVDQLQSKPDGQATTRAVEDLLEQALNAARETRDVDALIEVALRVALLKRDQGDFESALDDLGDLAVVARDKGDALALAVVLRHMGDIFLFGEDFEMARSYLGEAVALLERVPGIDPLMRAEHVRSLATCMDAQGEREKAQLCWRQARDLFLIAGEEAGATEAEAHLI